MRALGLLVCCLFAANGRAVLVAFPGRRVRVHWPPAVVAAKFIMSRVWPTADLGRCVTGSLGGPTAHDRVRCRWHDQSAQSIGHSQGEPYHRWSDRARQRHLYYRRSYDINGTAGIYPDNAVIRYMRFRLGTDPINDADDSFSITSGNNIMIDHVSASWGSDENLSITGIANNVTVQWSLISEALNANNHGYGSLIAPETQGTRITLHHNLYANNAGRTPRAGTRDYVTDFVFDYRNNVSYNWGTRG